MQQIGRYRITGELGRGAMGIVYRAEDPAIGRTVAVKTIRFSEMTDPQEVKQLRLRLMREARSAGILNHPGIVTVYDVAEDEEKAYVFMEFVDGDTLESRLHQSEAFPKESLLRLLRQTAAGLDFAHKKGIIHRDIKPANIMITSDGDAKITDFGVAKIVSQQMTQAGMVLGTPFYMSPEQIQGLPIDGRADQFSLGVVAYEILTGRRPYEAESMATLLLRIVTEAAPAPNSLNPTLGDPVSQIFAKVFAKTPGDRYPLCADFVEALATALKGNDHWQTAARHTVPAAGEGVDTALETALAQPEPYTTNQASAPTLTPASPPVSRPEAPPAPVSAPAPPPPRPSAPVAETPGKGLERRETPSQAGSGKKIAIAVAAVVIVAGAVAAWLQFGGERPVTSRPVTEVTAPVTSVPAPPAETAESGMATGVEGAAGGPDVDIAAEVGAATDSAEATPEPEPVETPPPPPPKPVIREHEVQVASTPVGATVTFDNNPEIGCLTPCSITLENGRHTMIASLAGYRDWLRIFNVPEELEIAVSLEEQTGTLALKSTPPGATIAINGEVRPEKTPAMLTLPAGTYEVVLTLEGYPETRQTMVVQDRSMSDFGVDW